MLSSPITMPARHRDAVENLTDDELPSLREALSTVDDPRCRRGVRYQCTDLLLAIAAAVISGARSLTTITEWVADAYDRGVLALWRRAPSIATLHRIIAGIDAAAFDAAVSSWIAARARSTTAHSDLEAIAVDGKEVRGAKHAGGTKTVLMAGLDHDTGTVLAQESVHEKTNEITHLPGLLDSLGPLDGRVVTADALHTLAQQATAITDRGGHYLLTVKSNAKQLYDQIAACRWTRRKSGYRHTEKAHGRTTSWDMTTAPAGTRIEFPGAAQIMRVQRGRHEHHNNEATGEVVYAITSLPATKATPEQLANLLRGHWGIENRLHWVRDTAYAEDASQIHAGTAAHLMASLRNLAISIHRLAGHKNITAALRHYARHPKLAAQLTGL